MASSLFSSRDKTPTPAGSRTTLQGWAAGSTTPEKAAAYAQSAQLRQNWSRTTPNYGGDSGDVTKSSVSKPDTSAAALRKAAAWRSANVREVTDSEWKNLTDTGKNQVRFSTQLMDSFRKDMSSPGTSNARTNTKDLYSRLGLPDTVKSNALESLGQTTGAVTRQRDLALKGNEPRTGSAATTSSMAKEINDYITSLQANEKSAASTFDSEDAQYVYEDALAHLRNPDELTTTSWATIATNLKNSGFEPADFKKYVLNTLPTLEQGEGESSLLLLKNWFGEE